MALLPGRPAQAPHTRLPLLLQIPPHPESRASVARSSHTANSAARGEVFRFVRAGGGRLGIPLIRKPTTVPNFVMKFP